MNEPERAVVIGWGSGPAPEPILSWFARAATSMVPAAPMAALSAWRTNVHARRWRAGQGRWWQGVAEAVAAGALVPMVILLPLVASRGLTGLACALAYALLGALLGLGIGLVLAAVAAAVLFTASRLSRSR